MTELSEVEQAKSNEKCSLFLEAIERAFRAHNVTANDLFVVLSMLFSRIVFSAAQAQGRAPNDVSEQLLNSLKEAVSLILEEENDKIGAQS